ncbi:MAG: hypothetical protein AB8H86_10775 [Polyangiales bacterium]
MTSSSHPPRPFRSLLGENEGSDYAEHIGKNGKIRAWHFGHQIGVFESSGSIEGAHARFVVEYFGTHLETRPRPWHAFGNWMHLDAYTPEVRKILTDWQVAQGYAELHVAADSALLALSINLANSLLKNTVAVVTNEERLDDIFLRVRERCGV